MGEDRKRPVLHVIVVGFHHKKGCQVEYSYPPLVPNGSVDCPPGWKYLPTLALPDGSHNYDKDTVFFHLPGLNHPNETVFGISCFRQIPVEKLKNRTSDITRGTVQKAVCVLSSVPLYGHIQVKMELITHAYFEEGDFTKVSLLEDTYHHLNGCLEQIDDLQQAPQLFVGLSARDLILTLRHKALLLYKLLLLEKKILFFQSPVQPLCSTILTLLSLHPGMIDSGLFQSACIKASRPMSPLPQFSESGGGSPGDEEVEDSCTTADLYQDVEEMKALPTDNSQLSGETTLNGNLQEPFTAGDPVEPEAEEDGGEAEPGKFQVKKPPHNLEELNGNSEAEEEGEEADVEDAMTEKMCNGDGGGSGAGLPPPAALSRDTSSLDLAHELNLQRTLADIAQIDPVQCGLPLPLFSNGYLCLPYLSLPYLDVLTDPNVRGYIVGATNILFKQKKNLADVIVELESGLIESSDVELRRAGHLSTEDLRFGEYLVRGVSDLKGDYLEGVGWEGGDEWVRAQFHAYTLCLLRTSLLQEGSKEIEQFNKWYVAALQSTQSYKAWLSNATSLNVTDVNPGHPFAGQLSVADMKLRFAHTMQTTEGGRKLNQAMVSTGRAVATTGRAVGGAISQAKGALTNWWSNLTTAPPGGAQISTPATDLTPAQPPALEDLEEQEPCEEAIQDESLST